MLQRSVNSVRLMGARVRAWRKPENVNTWLRLGEAYEGRSLEEKAVAAYQRAVEIAPDSAAAWHHVAAAYTRLCVRGYFTGDPRLREGSSGGQRQGLETAVNAFRKAIQLDPENAEVWNNLAYAYGQLDRRNDQVAALRQAVKINVDYVEAWHNLTTVYYNLRQFENVVGVCAEAVKHIPNDAHSWFDLGHAYEERGQLQDAVVAYEEAWRLRPEFPGPWVHLGVVYSKVGRIDDAVKVFLGALAERNRRKQFYLARTDLERNEHGQAVLRELAKVYPSVIRAGSNPSA